MNYNSTHSLHIRTLDKISQYYALLFLESIYQWGIVFTQKVYE